MLFRPAIEQLEAKQLLSAGSLAQILAAKHDPGALTIHSAGTSSAQVAPPTSRSATRHKRRALRHTPAPPGAVGYLAFRVTNTPHQTPYKLVPPFQQVLVQAEQPVPGQVYNVLDVTVKNGTSQTFNASNGFTVRLTNQPRSFSVPILTGKTRSGSPGR